MWQIPAAEPVPHTPREIPLVPVRVSSVFASRKEEEVDDGDISILDKDRIVRKHASLISLIQSPG